jgi:hypothetical protein
MNKEEKDVYPKLERNTLLSVYKCGFLLCSKLSEIHGGRTFLVDFLMLLFSILSFNNELICEFNITICFSLLFIWILQSQNSSRRCS